MSRGIDHLVLPVRDLAAARNTYSALGFTLTPRAVHPFGTANSLIQLDRCFLELLEIDDPDKILPTGGPASFAQFNRDFLRSGQGFSMLVLEGGDPVADADTFRRAGLRAREPFSFERDATLPDGTVARVGFTLVFVDFPRSDRAGFFTCHQHRPDLFWRPDYQDHANGAFTVANVGLMVPEPRDMAAFMAEFSGGQASSRPRGAHIIDTGRGNVQIIPAGPGDEIMPRFVSYSLETRDLASVVRHARAAGIPFTETESGLEFSADVMYGVRVAFSTPGKETAE